MAASYPSDYSVVQAASLVRLGSSGAGDTVPLIDLFPVFRSAQGISNSTPVPITQLCDANPRGSRSVESQPAAARESLAMCMQDKCLEVLGQVSTAGATLDALLRNSIESNGYKDELLLKHFNSVGAVQECAIKQCPLDYFVARSTICISLRHPFFVKGKIQLPAIPASLNATSMPPDWPISSLNVAWSFYQQALEDDKRTFSGNSVPFRSHMDLGILLPTLPAGFPCDSSRTNQEHGHLLRATRADTTFHRFPHMHTGDGTLLHSTGPSADTALSRDAGDDASIVTHPWMLKSIILRGARAGPVEDDVVRSGAALMPANLYSLGHCPAATSVFTGSGLAGDACKSALACVFASCVQGKCAEATVGKPIPMEQALKPVWDTRATYYDLKYQADAMWWTWIVLTCLGGLVVLRVGFVGVRAWQAKRAVSR